MIAGGRRPWSAGSLLGLAGVLHVLLPTPLAMVLALLHPQRMRKLAFGVCLLLASCHAALEPAVVAELSACPTGNQLFSSGIDLGEPQSSTKNTPAWLLGVAVAAASPSCHVAAGAYWRPAATTAAAAATLVPVQKQCWTPG